MVVYVVGGFVGLVGVIVLGLRFGWYDKDGKLILIFGYNLMFVVFGVFILWVGWYGFNLGSNLVFFDGVSVSVVMLIVLNIILVLVVGVIIVFVFVWVLFGKFDFIMGFNGVLVGFVGIIVNCDVVINYLVLIIGVVVGGLVVGGIILFDKLKIDDFVGVWFVYGLCGIWGCVVVGIFGGKNLLI